MNNIDVISLYDVLTGMYRQEYFENKLTEEINRSKRNKIPFSLICIEITNYLKYAQTLDEDELKRILISVCRAVKQATRDTDFSFLMDNGRIFIIMPYTDSFGAALVGEKICRQVKKIRWLKSEVTVTGAIATYLRETRRVPQLLNLLEERMGQAYKSGGNQIYSDTSEISLARRLDFYFRKKLALIKYHKKQVLFDLGVIILILSFAFYYIHSVYRERERWELQYSEDFSPGNMDVYWEVTSGRWDIENGTIQTIPGEALSYVLTHKLNFTGNYRIIMKGYFEKEAHISDLSLIIGGMAENPQKGYFVGIGSNENSRHKLLKQGEEILVHIGESLEHKTEYRVEVEKIDQHIIVKLNGETVLNYWDLFPLGDIRHNKISLYTFFPGVVITHFEVYSRKEPRMVPLFNIPDTLFRLGLYEQAYYEYRDLTYDYEGTDHYDILTFKKALCLMKLHRLDEAQILLKRVIYAGKNEELIPYAKQQLVQILVEKGQFGLALSSLHDLLDEYQDDEFVSGLYSSYLMSLGESLAASHPLASNDFFRSYIQIKRQDSYGCAYAKIQMMDNYLKVREYQGFRQTMRLFDEKYTYFRDFSFQRDRLRSQSAFIQGRSEEAFEIIRSMPQEYDDLAHSYPQLYAQKAQYYFYLEDYEGLEKLHDYIREKYKELENHDLVLVKTLWAFSRVLAGETRQGIEMLDALVSEFPSYSVFQMYPRLYQGYAYYLIEDYYLARESFVRASELALKQPEILRNSKIMVGLTFLAERNPFAAKDWFEEVMMRRPLFSLEHLCARFLLDAISTTQFLQKFTSEKQRLFPMAYFIAAEKALFHNNDNLAREYYRDSLKYSRWNDFPAFLVETRLEQARR